MSEDLYCKVHGLPDCSDLPDACDKVDRLARLVCRQAELGYDPCYQCKDTIKRLLVAQAKEQE